MEDNVKDSFVIPTSVEFDSLHNRITVMEEGLVILKSDTAEIVEWVRNAKLASKVTARVLASLGSFLLWVAKLVGAFAVLYTMYTAIRAGRFPDTFRF